MSLALIPGTLKVSHTSRAIKNTWGRGHDEPGRDKHRRSIEKNRLFYVPNVYYLPSLVLVATINEVLDVVRIRLGA